MARCSSLVPPTRTVKAVGTSGAGARPALGECRPGQVEMTRRPTRRPGSLRPGSANPPRDTGDRLHCRLVRSATQLLADLGAEVIRVENPSVFPPSTKGYEPRPNRKMVFSGLLAGYAPPPKEPPGPALQPSLDEQCGVPQQAVMHSGSPPA